MNIIIVGAGEVGSHLAKLLSVENQNIVIMDDKEDKIAVLQENFDLMGIVGNPTSISDMFGKARSQDQTLLRMIQLWK